MALAAGADGLANGRQVNRIRQDRNLVWHEVKRVGQIFSHGARLADDTVCVAIERAVKQARIAGEFSMRELSRDCSVLPHQHAGGCREERPEQ